MDPLGWALVVAGGVALVVLVDRLVARLPVRTEVRRRDEDRPRSSGAGPFGELVEILQPTARHLHEEQERQRHDLVLPGDADPPWAVDLDAGTAVLASAPVAGRSLTGRALEEVADGVLVATAQPWSTTTTVVVGPGGRCLVVDPALTPADLEALAATLAARGAVVEAGAATHPHWDHVLWSAALGDVPRWAAPAAVDRAARAHAALVAEADGTAPGHDPALLGRLRPLAGDVVPWSGRRVVVVPHAAHCPGSVALVVRDAGVLLAGDLLSDQEIPLLDPDATDPVADHLAALDALEGAAERWSVRVLVPGHGTVTDADGLARRLAVDRAYLTAVRDAARDGRTVEDPRLADAEQREHHEDQLRALRAADRHGDGARDRP
ncbi:MBL fold metallo-hydrolase [Actinotalea solisilvae]|uniref:MBL fold metallo-hydrolase n=1 Tax=Actinotalea solisilvae TaxID=2072922 RepID=UPI0018F25B01|nr:MBL fold metallo-hydrolase [Actinotalea solisilvae]